MILVNGDPCSSPFLRQHVRADETHGLEPAGNLAHGEVIAMFCPKTSVADTASSRRLTNIFAQFPQQLVFEAPGLPDSPGPSGHRPKKTEPSYAHA